MNTLEDNIKIARKAINIGLKDNARQRNKKKFRKYDPPKPPMVLMMDVISKYSSLQGNNTYNTQTNVYNKFKNQHGAEDQMNSFNQSKKNSDGQTKS